jgi:hypothetical protein
MAFLASIAVWSPRKLTAKLVALGGALFLMPVSYVAYADLLSRPKPVDFEWWLGSSKEATVLAGQVAEGDALYVWLQLDGSEEPRAYRLPWSQQAAEELNKALDEASRNGTNARMRIPFERSLDPDKPKFYALPQPALPPKDLEEGGEAAQRYVRPEVDA